MPSGFEMKGVIPVSNQQSATNRSIPLVGTLRKLGIVKPNEQELFIEYAKPYAKFDPKANDYIMDTPTAQALMNKMSKDRRFNNIVDATRVQNIQMGLHQVNMAMNNPTITNSMTPQERQFLSEYVTKLDQQKAAIAKRTMVSHAIETGQMTEEQARQLQGGGQQEEATTGQPIDNDITLGGIL